MNVVQNKKKPGAKPRRAGYHQGLNFKFVEEANPERIVNRKVLNEINKDSFGNTTTINTTSSSGDSQVILALTEGRCQARGEIGIAAIDINSPTLILCQISDNPHYSDTLNKITMLNPITILLPDTIFETFPLTKLIQLIKENFNHIGLVPIERRLFNDTYGLEQITSLSSQKSKNIIQIIQKKYYCLSAASALLDYLKIVHIISFADNCLRVVYQTKQDGMLIDTQTSARLELLYSLSNEASALRNFSLFAVLNHCSTRIGQRHLRANILEPSCNIDFIRNRQEQIKVLIENGKLQAELKEKLQTFKSVDQLLKISCVVPVEDCSKAIETNIQMAILLKQCLEGVKSLAETVQETISESFEEARILLSSPVFDEIIARVDTVLQPDIHKNRLAQKHFQHLFAVKAYVDNTIDSLRKLYSEATDSIRVYVAELTEQSQLPVKLIHSTKLGHHLYMKNPNELILPEEFNMIYRKGTSVYTTTAQLISLNDRTRTIGSEIIQLSNIILCNLLFGIATEIDVIHHLIAVIIDLDLVQSLTEASNKENYCCPTFDRVMRIEDAYHPMLEIARNKDTDVITNNVIATPQYNFYLISGPNMSGKTIYIKMIAILQIMAQIGCFVPAKSAKLRITDKIFSRIGFSDSIELGASTFTVELREMEYIYSNLTPNSLVIMDELCRSTNPQEGEIICWKFCDRLLNFGGIADENYFKSANEDNDVAGQNKTNATLQILNSEYKLKDVSRPFVYLTTHFTSLTKLSEKYNNAVNLHMHVQERLVDDAIRLEFKYKMQSGPTTVKSYGLALARCLRFPTSLLDRAEELAENIFEESLIDVTKLNRSKYGSDDIPMEVSSVDTLVSEEMTELNREVIDLYSYVLLLMSSRNEDNGVSIDTINVKLKQLILRMSPEFKQLIEISSLEAVISVLNASRASESFLNL